MSLLLGRNADDRTKFIVFAYYRQHELLFNMSIPSVIPYLSVAYYYNREFFAKGREDCYKISEDGLTVISVRNVKWNAGCVYLNKWIESGSIASWKFKINKIISALSIMFKIVSRESDDLNSSPMQTYTLCSFLDIGAGFDVLSTSFVEGDQVTIKLDLKHRKVSLQVNDGNEVIKLEDIFQISQDIRYKMTVWLSATGSSVTLEEFTCKI